MTSKGVGLRYSRFPERSEKIAKPNPKTNHSFPVKEQINASLQLSASGPSKCKHWQFEHK
jgi:hypothetical protein